ncbi:hypothetical protein OYT88_17935 [Sporolactobacillus sp. CQH2019]|nr:hypothetical protein [Sporolactobacillus sp. CQH2019]MDD9150419.1 hypothetical protein [Sporolactobacillus sp. CQH2019]
MIQKNKSYQFFSSQKLDSALKSAVRINQDALIQRYLENTRARQLGFLVYAHGQFYELQYGRTSFLYIERFSLSGDFEAASVWRETYLSGRKASSKMVVMAKDVSFAKAFGQATSFIDWLNKKRGHVIANQQPSKQITVWEMD